MNGVYLHLYRGDTMLTSLVDVSEADFYIWLDKVDGVQATLFELIRSSGRLFLRPLPNGRVHVMFKSGTDQLAVLIDGSQPADIELEFPFPNTRPDVLPMTWTVDLPIARQVAEYFFAFNALPRDLDWAGNIPGFYDEDEA